MQSMKAKKRVKLFDYYLRKGGISGARIRVKTVAERAKKELCIKSWGDYIPYRSEISSG